MDDPPDDLFPSQEAAGSSENDRGRPKRDDRSLKK